MYIDLFVLILDKLADATNLEFLKITADIYHSCVDKIIFTSLVKYCNIETSPYFNNFINVEIATEPAILPKKIKYLTLSESCESVYITLDTITHMTIHNNQKNIPPSVEYIKFGYNFNHPISIPISVTKILVPWNYRYKFSLPQRCKVIYFNSDYSLLSSDIYKFKYLEYKKKYTMLKGALK